MTAPVLAKVRCQLMPLLKILLEASNLELRQMQLQNNHPLVMRAGERKQRVGGWRSKIGLVPKLLPSGKGSPNTHARRADHERFWLVQADKNQLGGGLAGEHSSQRCHIGSQDGSTHLHPVNLQYAPSPPETVTAQGWPALTRRNI